MRSRSIGVADATWSAGYIALTLSTAFACSEPERPPPANFAAPAPSTTSSGIPVPDGLGMGCGQEAIAATVDVPRLYFVLDRSGSMSELLPDESTDKWNATQSAVAGLLRSIGHRIEYGAAVFPGSAETCKAGRQVFPFSRGDPWRGMVSNRNGPRLQSLMDRLSALDPAGGTPVSATLALLLPLLSEDVSARTYVVLATDGAPNCNENASCDSSRCIPDLEGAMLNGRLCGDGFSCCDPELLGEGAGANCVDDQETLVQIEALSAAGIPTYVIGMPGAAQYADVLDRFAEAGGTARPDRTRYYAVDDSVELYDALLEIGTGVAIECDLSLNEVPADASLVNVSYDGRLVPYGESDGWVWDGESALSMRGAACDELRSGTVQSVSIIYGCTTVIE